MLFYRIKVPIMSGEIKTFFLGKECHDCEALGVHCKQVGVFTFGVPAGTGQVAIYLDEKPVLRTAETIDECPAVTGESTNEEVVDKIKQNAKKAAGWVSIDQIGNL